MTEWFLPMKHEKPSQSLEHHPIRRTNHLGIVMYNIVLFIHAFSAIPLTFFPSRKSVPKLTRRNVYGMQVDEAVGHFVFRWHRHFNNLQRIEKRRYDESSSAFSPRFTVFSCASCIILPSSWRPHCCRWD